jgi:cyclopropane fatty-acyl-phospholipid synthase-like methyltransferase
VSEEKLSKEPQYQIQIDTLDKIGPVEMGPTASHTWRSDPRRLTFLLARYKFCSKMLAGKSRILEVGCGDGFGMRVVLQTVDSIHGVDFDPLFVEWGSKHARSEGLNCTFSTTDITKEAPPGRYDAAYSLDMIEHLEPSQEHLYWKNVCRVLEQQAIFIVGTPNITASPYASQWSMEGHINLKSAETLSSAMTEFFHNVFIFSMNDEVIHTGFYPMAHYLFAMGVGLRQDVRI